MTSEEFDPVTNPDVQEALSYKYSSYAILLIPLKSGRVALLDRSYTLQAIVDEVPPIDELRRLSQEFYVRLRQNLAAEARFYGEPDDKMLSKDLRKSRKPERAPRVSPKESAVVDIDLELDL